jgi:hypothetical protein
MVLRHDYQPFVEGSNGRPLTSYHGLHWYSTSPLDAGTKAWEEFMESHFSVVASESGPQLLTSYVRQRSRADESEDVDRSCDIPIH